jgi:hypothetical protein
MTPLPGSDWMTSGAEPDRLRKCPARLVQLSGASEPAHSSGTLLPQEDLRECSLLDMRLLEEEGLLTRHEVLERVKRLRGRGGGESAEGISC